MNARHEQMERHIPFSVAYLDVDLRRVGQEERPHDLQYVVGRHQVGAVQRYEALLVADGAGGGMDGQELPNGDDGRPGRVAGHVQRRPAPSEHEIGLR